MKKPLDVSIGEDFLYMTKGLSTSQIAWLLRDDLFQPVKIFSLSRKSVTTASPHSVPWFVAWYLTWFNKKFRQKPKKILPWSMINASVDRLTDKLSWRAKHFHNDCIEFSRLSVRRKPVSFPEHEKPPELIGWSKGLKRELWDTYLQVKNSRFSPARKPPIIAKARTWLLNSGHLVLPADKAGEAVLVTHNDLIDSHGDLLTHENFRFVTGAEEQLLYPELYEDTHVRPFLKIAKQIAISDEEMRASDLRSGLSNGFAGMTSKLQSIVKTHKMDG